MDGYFLQTVVPSAVVTRLTMTNSGDIQVSGVTVGKYGPYQPFRVRMDIDMSGKTWWVTVDDELNGFYDDLVFGDLPFGNPASVLPRVSMVSLSLYPALSQGFTSVAYDDIRVSAPHQRPLG